MMTITASKGNFSSGGWTYRLNFEWSASEGKDIRIKIQTYHAQYDLVIWADDGVLLDEYGTYLYNFNVSDLPPYFRLVIKASTTREYEEEFVVANHPNHPADSYIKPLRAPVHTQWAEYKGAKYVYEVNSCVANSLCAGMDTCHRTRYNTPSRPSVGYLYGAVEKDKDDSFGMLFESALNYLTTKGVATASILTSNASQNRYPHCHFKQSRSIPTSSSSIVAEGGVQMHNRESKLANVSVTEQFAKLSSYTKCNILHQNIDMMQATQFNNKFVMMCLGVCTEFDNASDNGGICGRLMKNTSFRMGHSCYVVGWKKIGIEYYWILQNSWGWEKGDNGLMYVPFSWFWTTRSNGDAGLWYGYICNYQDNGQLLLPAIPPPILNTTEGKDGRGEDGCLYFSFKDMRPEEKDPIRRYQFVFTDEQGVATNKTSSGYGGKDYFYLSKFGETFKVKIRYETVSEVVSAYSSENLVTTLPKEATISFNKATQNSITINVNVSTGNWTDVAVHLYSSGVYQKSIIVPKGATTCTFTDLKSGTQYTFDAETRYTIRGVTLKSYNKSNKVTASTGISVTKFYWTSSISQNGNITNSTGSDNSLYVYPITSTEWNSYIATLKRVREIKNITTSRPLNTVSRGGYLTARVNEAINALNDLLPTGKMSTITASTNVTAQIFLDLQNKLNSVIDGL